MLKNPEHVDRLGAHYWLQAMLNLVCIRHVSAIHVHRIADFLQCLLADGAGFFDAFVQ